MSQTKKKILFLSPSVCRPNFTRTQLFAILAQNNYEVKILGPAKKNDRQFMIGDKLDIGRLPYHDSLHRIKEVYRQMNNYDCVVACDARLYSATAGLLARLRGKRFVYDTGEHQVGSNYFEFKNQKGSNLKLRYHTLASVIKAKITITLRHFAHEITVSSKPLQEKYGGHVLPVPVDVNFFKTGNIKNIRKKYPGIIIMHLGVIQRNKGIDLIIKSFPYIKDQIPNAKLLFVGAASDKKYSLEMEELAASISKDIIFAGKNKTNFETRNYLNSAHILVYSSEDNITHNFQHPIKLNLYMSTKKPIVATNIGNAPQILRSCASLVKPTPKNLANGIIKTYKNKDFSKKIASNAFNKALKQYSNEITSKKIAKIYLGE